MPRSFDEEDDGMPDEIDWRKDRISELIKGSPVAGKTLPSPRPRGKVWGARAGAFDDDGLRMSYGAYTVKADPTYSGKKPEPKEPSKEATALFDVSKFDAAARAKWESVLDTPFKTVDGELVCARCEEGEYDCRCENNPWVARTYQTDPLVKEFGVSRNGHPHFSGSGAPGFLHCDAYVLVNAGLPDRTSEYAAYGTICHKIASDYLEARHEGRWPNWKAFTKPLQGATRQCEGFSFEVDQVMLAACHEYVKCCLRDVKPGDEVLTERKVWYSRYLPIPGQGGTLDFGILRRGQCLIRDAKFGEGVKVFAKENEQLLTYAGGVIEEFDWLYDFKEFDFIISQPRMDHEDHWSCGREEVLAHMERVRAAGIRSWKKNAPRTPGPKQCRWCADKLCPAKSAMIGDAMAGGFDAESPFYTSDDLETHRVDMEVAVAFDKPPEPVPLTGLSVAALALRKKFRPVVDGYFAAIEEELLLRARRGENIPFFDHVEGRASNQWVDEDAAADALESMGVPSDKIHDRKIVSVKRATEQLRAVGYKPKDIKAWLFNTNKTAEVTLAQRIPGKTVLAPIEEGRLKYADEIASGFDTDDDDGFS